MPSGYIPLTSHTTYMTLYEAPCPGCGQDVPWRHTQYEPWPDPQCADCEEVTP